MADLGAIARLSAVFSPLSLGLRRVAAHRCARLMSAPDAGSLALSGTVTDDGSVAAVRALNIYRRDTGQLVERTVSDPTTGAWSVTVCDAVEHDVICLDDSAGTTHNDLIHRATPV